MPTIVPIPGGTATLRDPGHPTVRDKRRAQVLALRIGSDPDFAAAMASADKDTPVTVLGDRSLDILGRTNEIRVLNLLESWTIDRPLPQWFDDLDDLPLEIFNPIDDAAARLAEEAEAAAPKDEDGKPALDADGNPADPYSADAAPDPTAPTGASVGSKGRSTAVVRRQPSDRKKPAGSKSGSTGVRSAG
jgi:hypothetical protein